MVTCEHWHSQWHSTRRAPYEVKHDIMTRQLTDSELEAYLDEALTPPEMAAIEAELRKSPETAQAAGQDPQPA